MINKKVYLLLLFLFLAAGCSSINPYYEEPEVSVDSFSLKSADKLNPVFEVGLRITNPNKAAINISGLSYSATVEGQKILTGVSGKAINVAGYSEETLKLEAKASLLSGFQLLSKLLNNNTKTPNYSLRIKMDVGSFKLPIIVTREGTINSLIEGK